MSRRKVLNGGTRSRGQRWPLALVALMSGVYLVFIALFRTTISDF